MNNPLGDPVSWSEHVVGTRVKFALSVLGMAFLTFLAVTESVQRGWTSAWGVIGALLIYQILFVYGLYRLLAAHRRATNASVAAA